MVVCFVFMNNHKVKLGRPESLIAGEAPKVAYIFRHLHLVGEIQCGVMFNDRLCIPTKSNWLMNEFTLN